MSEYIEDLNQEEEGISLQDLFKVIWNNKILIVFVTAWVVVIGILYTFIAVTPKYTAHASVMIQVSVGEEVQSEQQALYVADRLRGTYQQFIVSNSVLSSVVEDLPELEGTSLSSIKNSISISSPDDALIIYISVQNESPLIAQEIVNQLIENSIALANDEENDGENAFIYLEDRLILLDEASLPSSPSSPNKMLNVVISIILGGIVALGVVFAKEFFNNKFKTSDELEKYLNVKVLASVPGTVKQRKVVE
jgi:capsular polysaccharide biosynthesis protein